MEGPTLNSCSCKSMDKTDGKQHCTLYQTKYITNTYIFDNDGNNLKCTCKHGLHQMKTLSFNQQIWLIAIYGLLFCILPTGANTTVSSTTVTGSVTITEAELDVPQAVIVVAALVGFFIISILVAKLFEYWYDRRAIRDDASDISDYTKELLKAQMMMMIFNRGRQKGKKLKPEEAAKKYSKVWRAKVARNKARRMKAQKDANKAVEAVAAVKTGHNKPAQPAKLNTVNELNQLPLGATAKTGSVTIPKQPLPGSGKKGSARPISSGLKSRPVSAKSTGRPKSGFKSFGKFMVRK